MILHPRFFETYQKTYTEAQSSEDYSNALYTIFRTLVSTESGYTYNETMYPKNHEPLKDLIDAGKDIDAKTIVLNSNDELSTAVGGWHETESGTTETQTGICSSGSISFTSGDCDVTVGDSFKITLETTSKVDFTYEVASWPATNSITIPAPYGWNSDIAVYYASPTFTLLSTDFVNNENFTATISASYIDEYHKSDARYIDIDGTSITLNSSNQLQASGSSPDNKAIIVDSDGKLTTQVGGYFEGEHIIYQKDFVAKPVVVDVLGTTAVSGLGFEAGNTVTIVLGASGEEQITYTGTYVTFPTTTILTGTNGATIGFLYQATTGEIAIQAQSGITFVTGTKYLFDVKVSSHNLLVKSDATFIDIDTVTTTLDANTQLKARSAIEVSALGFTGKIDVLYRLTADWTDSLFVVWPAGLYVYDSATTAWKRVDGGTNADEQTIVFNDDNELETVVGGWKENGETQTINISTLIPSTGSISFVGTGTAPIDGNNISIEISTTRYGNIEYFGPYPSANTLTIPCTDTSYTEDIVMTYVAATDTYTLTSNDISAGDTLTCDIEFDSSIFHKSDARFVDIDNETIVLDVNNKLKATAAPKIDKKTIIKNENSAYAEVDAIMTAVGGWKEEGDITVFDCDKTIPSEETWTVPADKDVDFDSSSSGTLTITMGATTQDFACSYDSTYGGLNVANTFIISHTTIGQYDFYFPSCPWAGNTMHFTLVMDDETIYHKSDARFVDIDGTTITLDANNKLKALAGIADNKTILQNDNNEFYTAVGGWDETNQYTKSTSGVVSAAGIYLIADYDPCPGQEFSISFTIDGTTQTDIFAWPTSNSYTVPASVFTDDYTITYVPTSAWFVFTGDSLNDGDPFTVQLEYKYSTEIHKSDARFIDFDNETIVLNNENKLAAKSALIIDDLAFTGEKETMYYLTTEYTSGGITYKPGLYIYDTTDGWTAVGGTVSIDEKTIIENDNGELETAIGGWKVDSSTIADMDFYSSYSSTSALYFIIPGGSQAKYLLEDKIWTFEITAPSGHSVRFTEVEFDCSDTDAEATVIGNDNFEYLLTGFAAQPYIKFERTDGTAAFESGNYTGTIKNVNVDYHLIDGHFIPVDHDTIGLNSDGELMATNIIGIDADETTIENIDGVLSTVIGGSKTTTYTAYAAATTYGWAGYDEVNVSILEGATAPVDGDIVKFQFVCDDANMWYTGTYNSASQKAAGTIHGNLGTGIGIIDFTTSEDGYVNCYETNHDIDFPAGNISAYVGIEVYTPNPINAQYVPIDNNTITINSSGKLQAAYASGYTPDGTTIYQNASGTITTSIGGYSTSGSSVLTPYTISDSYSSHYVALRSASPSGTITGLSEQEPADGSTVNWSIYRAAAIITTWSLYATETGTYSSATKTVTGTNSSLTFVGSGSWTLTISGLSSRNFNFGILADGYYESGSAAVYNVINSFRFLFSPVDMSVVCGEGSLSVLAYRAYKFLGTDWYWIMVSCKWTTGKTTAAGWWDDDFFTTFQIDNRVPSITQNLKLDINSGVEKGMTAYMKKDSTYLGLACVNSVTFYSGDSFFLSGPVFLGSNDGTGWPTT